MKKVLYLFMFLLVGCTCIGQIPPQTIYVDQNCEAIVPDYLPYVVVRDNCGIDTIYQTPAPGYAITFDTPQITASITAVDVYGNQTVVEFTITAIDTTPPTITADSTILTVLTDQMDGMLKGYHNAMREYLIAAEAFKPFWLDSLLKANGDSSLYVDDWYNKNILVTLPAGGQGYYLGNFYPTTKAVCYCDPDSIPSNIIISVADNNYPKQTTRLVY